MSRRAAAAGLLALATAGCRLDPTPEAWDDDVCDGVAVRADLPDAIRESSGIAVSNRYPGVFWTHNDSGGDSAVFAIDSTGAILARIRIRGATNRDWEDVELAPCQPGSSRDCLFIGDIGDNRQRRDRVVIYRVPEPDPWRDTLSDRAESFPARYPRGPADAEALFVTDLGIHVITKGRSGPVELFRIAPPYRPGVAVTLRHVQTLAPPPTSVSAHVTAAAATRDGRTVAVRGYGTVRFYEPDGDTLRLLVGPAALVVPGQMQGEAVDFLPDGRLVLTGEAGPRFPATIAIARCEARPAPPDTVG